MRTLGRLLLASTLLATAACDCGGGEPGIHSIHAKLEVSPEALNFEKVAVGNSRELPLTLKNAGEARLAVRQLTVDGDPFGLTVPELITLNANEEKVVTVRFSPAAVGEFQGSVEIETDATDVAVTVNLSGIGVQPGVEVTPSGDRCGDTARSISFGGTSVGNANVQHVSLKSIGSSTTTILGARVEGSTGEFTVMSPPAGTQLPPGSTFDVAVQYQPTDTTMDSATLVILTDAVGETEIRVALCGEGTKAALCGNPVPIDVGRVDLGGTGQVPFQLSNCGNQAVSLTGLAISSDAAHPSAPGFSAMGPALPTTLMPNDTVSVMVSYTPPALGPVTAYLAAASSAGNDFFPIVARGVEPCDLSPLPATLNFGTVAAGATADRQLQLANQAAAACTITRIEVTTLSGTFSVVSPPSLPQAVPPGGSQGLTVRYAPASAQQSNGVLEVEAGRSVRQIPLIGNAPPTPGCHLEASPSPLAFGVVGVGQSMSKMLTIRNTSTMSDCHLSSVTVDAASDPGFTLPAQGAATITPGMSITLNVTYRPTAPASAHGTLKVASDDTTNPTLDVPMTATGQGPGICVMPTLLSYGNVMGSRDLTFNIVACGSAAVSVTGLPFSLANPQFTLVSPPATPFNLAAGASRTITVRYTPTTMTGAMGAVDVRSNDPVSPSITVHLEGGAQIVPPSAGRFLYYWQVGTGLGGSGDVMRLPLQGMSTPQPYWGVSTGKPCSGCHALSPDGRYLALVNSTTNFGVEVVDTTTNQRVPLGFTVQNAFMITWRPNVNSTPPYQFAFDDGDTVQIASVTGGLIGPLRGADTAGFKHKMPTWGPNGKIAFVRGTRELTPFGVPRLLGIGTPADIMTVPETGGTATALAGASGSGLNYYPAYSPNGQWIAFTTSSGLTSYAATDASIHIVAADGSGRSPNLGALNGAMGANSFPTWSHDGAFLSFSSNRPGGLGDWDIWFAPIDPMTAIPGAAVNLREANTAGFDHVARWSP